MVSAGSPFTKRIFLIFAFLLALPFFPGPDARAYEIDKIPETLRPWIPWVLKDHEAELCPYLMGGGEERHCVWASPLNLNLTGQAGQFSQGWHVYAEGWLPLPGDEDHWPQEVTANGEAVAVVNRDGVPHLYLKPGIYRVTGSFRWDQLPESFSIPPETGILQLTVNGQAKPFPQIDEAQGLVWLQRESQEEKEENRLEMRVFRKLTDDIPFILTIQLVLNVSGQAREVLFEGAVPEGFSPMELNSALPARVEQGRNLRIQIKPGEWRVELQARHLGPVASLALEAHAEPWPPEEVWVFEARNDLRLVWAEGVPSIDPQQTTLPEEWKGFPAYRLKTGETLRLVEKRRGDSDPAPDQLTLYRQWWLDFDGGGFTLHDSLSGTLRRSWRLEMNPPVQLGRISVAGKDQFITRLPAGKEGLPGEEKWGIEVRQGAVDVSADSRIDGKVRKVAAVGWNHDFQSVSGELNLPPGWRLFSVTGADEVPGTWISQWTLLDIFLVLILALTFAKLWGWKWGGLALVTLTLTFPEGDAPHWVWLAVVAGSAVLKLLKPGKFFTLMRLYKGITLLILVIVAIPFMVRQLRVGVYPALEHPYQGLEMAAPVSGKREGMVLPAPMKAQPPAGLAEKPEEGEDNAPPAAEDQEMRPQQTELSYGGSSTNKEAVMRMKKYESGIQQNLEEQRPGTKVQTGPGLPRWQWNRFVLEWNGPVEKTQEIRFCLIPPWANLVLAVIRVLLLALLILVTLGISQEAWRRLLPARVAPWFLLLVMALGLGAAPRNADAGDFPPAEFLEQLKEQLLENPACYPDCASIGRMSLVVGPTELQARLEVNVQAVTAVPLPGGAKEWTPAEVGVGGQAASGLIRTEDGRLWLELGPGVHQVTLSGPLPERETVQLSLPLRPYQVIAQVSGWTLEGLHEDGVADSTLQLTRLQSDTAASRRGAGSRGNGGLEPFVRVERELILGLQWEVVTRVVRVSSAGVPVVLEVPLLEGESVTTPGIRVENRKALVNISPGEDELEWRSVLSESPRIQLKAPDAPAYMEVWYLNVGPVWHVQLSGIPMIHMASEVGQWLPQWRPWPGEEIGIQVTRPEGVPGQTLTIDRSLTEVTPGLRFTEFITSLTLRSSLGGQHVITLPQGAQLQSVAVNGLEQPIRLDQGKITLPVVPGEQHFKITWQQSEGIKALFRAPEMDLGVPSVNTELSFHMPRNRWILFAWGPTLGPAVQFWSLLAVLTLFAFGLSRLGWSPLRTWHWVLLGIGITQFPEFPVVASVFVAGWLLSLGWRKNTPGMHKFWFDMRQIALVFYTFFALLALFAAIHQGLLGLPEMQIAGNGSTGDLLRWYQDRSSPLLPRPWVISIPLFYYRLAMLAWALWIALALLKWLKWGWGCFTEQGAWKSLGIFKKKAL
jgi:hypothetical protein